MGNAGFLPPMGRTRNRNNPPDEFPGHNPFQTAREEPIIEEDDFGDGLPDARGPAGHYADFQGQGREDYPSPGRGRRPTGPRRGR